jgi:hypothetical protein
MIGNQETDLMLRIRAFADLRRELGETPNDYRGWIRQELFRLTFISLHQPASPKGQILLSPVSPSEPKTQRHFPLSDPSYSVGFLSKSTTFEIEADLSNTLDKELLKITSEVAESTRLQTFLKKTSPGLKAIIKNYQLLSDLPGVPNFESTTRDGRSWFLAHLVDDSLNEQESLKAIQVHRQMIQRLIRSASVKGPEPFIFEAHQLSAEGLPRIKWTLFVEEVIHEYLKVKDEFHKKGHDFVPRPAEIMTVAMWEKEQSHIVDISTGIKQAISDDYRFLQILGSAGVDF